MHNEDNATLKSRCLTRSRTLIGPVRFVCVLSDQRWYLPYRGHNYRQTLPKTCIAATTIPEWVTSSGSDSTCVQNFVDFVGAKINRNRY